MRNPASSSRFLAGTSVTCGNLSSVVEFSLIVISLVAALSPHPDLQTGWSPVYPYFSAPAGFPIHTLSKEIHLRVRSEIGSSGSVKKRSDSVSKRDCHTDAIILKWAEDIHPEVKGCMSSSVLKMRVRRPTKENSSVKNMPI